MAFILTLNPEEQSATVNRHGNEIVVIVPLGYDDARPLIYSLMLGLSPMAGGDLEFFFCIIEADNQYNTEKQLWSGLDTTEIFSGEHRTSILKGLLGATEMLVNAVKPSQVTMCTIDTGAPKKADRKHLLIARVFETCGYAVKCADEYHGKRVWQMERQPEAVRSMAAGGGDHDEA